MSIASPPSTLRLELAPGGPTTAEMFGAPLPLELALRLAQPLLLPTAAPGHPPPPLLALAPFAQLSLGLPLPLTEGHAVLLSDGDPVPDWHRVLLGVAEEVPVAVAVALGVLAAEEEPEGVMLGLLLSLPVALGLAPRVRLEEGVTLELALTLRVLEGVLLGVRLAVGELEAVGLLEGVRFWKGLFSDTLPQFVAANKGAPIAVLRRDGNFYFSYQDATCSDQRN
jgi:hypothetical protein